MKPNTTYTDKNIDGQTLIMIEKNLPSGIRFYIGSRFQQLIITKNVHHAFDFYRNYAILFNYNDLPAAWKAYKKAANQTTLTVRCAFWHYLDTLSSNTYHEKENEQR